MCPGVHLATCTPTLILLGPFFQWEGGQGCERGVTEISPQPRHGESARPCEGVSQRQTSVKSKGWKKGSSEFPKSAPSKPIPN